MRALAHVLRVRACVWSGSLSVRAGLRVVRVVRGCVCVKVWRIVHFEKGVWEVVCSRAESIFECFGTLPDKHAAQRAAFEINDKYLSENNNNNNNNTSSSPREGGVNIVLVQKPLAYMYIYTTQITGM